MRDSFLLYLIYSIAVLLALTSCEEDKPLNAIDNPKESVCVVFAARTPSKQLKTKGFGDYDVPPQNTRDALLDGLAFYRFTAFLIDLTDQELIAYRDLYPNSEDLSGNNSLGSKLQEDFYSNACFQTAQLTFSNKELLHGTVETLKVGHGYRLIAIANCTSIELNLGFGKQTETNTRPISIVYNNYLTKEIEAIKSYFRDNPTRGISVKSDLFQNLFNKKISLSPESNICTEEAMPMSLVTDFILNSGTNRIVTNLKRIFARIRIAVRNTSVNSSLKVTALSFDHFTQEGTFIFDDPNQPDRKFKHMKNVIPDATNETATKPFAMCIVPREETISIFDAYIPESKLNKAYQFKIKFEYINFNLENRTITNTNDLRDGATYLVYEPSTNRYLKSSDNRDLVICEKISETNILSQNTNPFLWIFLKDYRGIRDKHRLQSVETAKFMGFRYELFSGKLDRFVRLDTKSYYYSSDYLNILLNNENNKGISIARDVFFYNYHLGSPSIYIDENNNVLPIEQENGPHKKTLFHFQEVTQGSKSSVKEETVSAQFNEIHRNDFIQLLVSIKSIDN